MRRSVSSILGAALAALLSTSSCSPSGQTGSAADAPVLFQWEDYVDPPFLAEYRKAHNDTPQTAIFADEDEAFAKMRAGYKPDVMGPCYYEFPRWQKPGCCSRSTRRSLPTGTSFPKPCATCPEFPPARARCGSFPIIGETPQSPIAPISRPNMSATSPGTSCSIPNTRAASRCSKAWTTRSPSLRA
jgi:hypothetical protein